MISRSTAKMKKAPTGPMTNVSGLKTEPKMPINAEAQALRRVKASAVDAVTAVAEET